ncbi:hypothetical protein [Streptomyces jumonjinensis]|uniref:LPXTG cell wall anchor domain-containing protein n=1 Tax=Streptomyces jumonjinensis TaxID=1945 RepID=A0A646KBN6_STRJU|nr:hypothetical protein [Streptomyces jumonjinensis]MQS99366.1 hypothetical protein [Streptomyces jumonjinensis]
MRSRSTALRTVGVAAALVIAPAAAGAYAHDSVTVTVHPAGARPGDEVEIRVQGCEATAGAARSRAFAVAAELSELSAGRSGSVQESDGGSDSGAGRGSGRTGHGHGSRALTGVTVLAPEATPGVYDITVACGGHDHPAPGAVRIAESRPRPDDRATPVAPIRAGGGGTAVLSTGKQAGHGGEAEDARHGGEPEDAKDGKDAKDTGSAESAGPSTPHTVVGLVLAGVAAAVVAFRSSRRRRTGSD